ncbi:nucleobase:cation symporter-2 family protein [Anaerocolumna aminovalerica]|uniref:Nucleobase:cation symporter-2, NCS2 family n=2 Tax=Anaerocolumna aminovalerica TaxID=1527 RepID=A0A1I5G9C3_9FIRM|nr:nucleobase:cation symporter-2 family protein [Anaerocolumna aminovalerica]SFO32635.1 nucleobase:cation symporter-2, NCS2 family [Anaerocolumna aminovalerica]
MSSNKSTKQHASIFQLEGRPAMKEAIPLAFQHVMAMIVGCVTPAIVVAGVAGLNTQDKVILIQASLVISAIATFIQVFSIGGFFGSRLPVILGISFAYLPSLTAIASGFNMATIFGAQIVGGVCAILFGLFVEKLRKFFPPLITGTVVFTIGLSLYPTAINYIAGGAGSPNYGSWQNWLVGLLTMAIVLVLNHWGKGIVKLASLLIGLIIGYIISAFFGMISFADVANAGYFQIPQPLHFGVEFEVSSIITIALLFIINSVQAIGDFTATTSGGLDRLPTDKELKGGITGYGLLNILGAFFGGMPTATYSQNVGIVATTKVVNRAIFGIASGIILVAGLVPKFSALLTTIPYCVLGGAVIGVFASITMTGMKLIATQELNYRNTSIVGLAVSMGIGITLVPQSLALFPAWVTTVFGKSPVVVATIVAIVLNLVLPGKEKEDSVQS